MKLVKPVSFLSAVAVVAATSVAMADIERPGDPISCTGPGSTQPACQPGPTGSCSIAFGRTTVAGLMLFVGATALLVSRRRKD